MPVLLPVLAATKTIGITSTWAETRQIKSMVALSPQLPFPVRIRPQFLRILQTIQAHFLLRPVTSLPSRKRPLPLSPVHSSANPQPQ